jgi:hypothetical protein
MSDFIKNHSGWTINAWSVLATFNGNSSLSIVTRLAPLLVCLTIASCDGDQNSSANVEPGSTVAASGGTFATPASSRTDAEKSAAGTVAVEPETAEISVVQITPATPESGTIPVSPVDPASPPPVVVVPPVVTPPVVVVPPVVTPPVVVVPPVVTPPVNVAVCLPTEDTVGPSATSISIL